MEYPIIEQGDRGFKVRTSPGSFLPGSYLTYISAQKAVMGYLGRRAEAAQKRQARKNKG